MKRKMERKAAEKELFGYTNDDNPFGDANLTKPFVWKKKWQKLKEEGKRRKPLTKAELRERQLKLRSEIDEVKRRREAREREQREEEEMKAQLQRDLDWAANAGWEQREEEFQRRQTNLRSRIRLQEGRERPVDLLWRSLRGFLGLQRRRMGLSEEEVLAESEKMSIIEDDEEVQRREEEDLANADSVEPLRLLAILELEELEQLEKDVEEVVAALPPPDEDDAPDDPEMAGREGDGSWRRRGAEDGSTRGEGENQVSDALSRFLDSVQESEAEWNDPGQVERKFWESVKLCLADAKWRAPRGGDSMTFGRSSHHHHHHRQHHRQEYGRDRHHHSRDWDRDRERDGGGFDRRRLLDRDRDADRDRKLGVDDYAFVGVHESVRPSLKRLLEGKNLSQLQQLEEEVNTSIARGSLPDGAALDYTYWEALRKVLKVYLARAYLEAFHERLLINKLDWLRKRQMEEVDSAVGDLRKQARRDAAALGGVGDAETADGEPGFGDLPHSPKLYPLDTDVGELDVLEEEEDLRHLRRQREVVLEKLRTQSLPSQRGAQKSEPQSRGPETESGVRLGDGEAGFSVEAPSALVPDQAYWWQDKYRPRKPRYFNRVKTGYEWNKYNRTHYERENPPPKIVQGYKFNIFYPDLIDPTQTPVYLLEPIPGEPDHCIIRFRAGPPYEDIAFKIVRKEWDYNRRRGFRCVFDRGVLQLYFNFKRYFYRR